MNFEQKIVNSIKELNCNFVCNIPTEYQSSIIDLASKKIILNKDRTYYPIVIDSSEIVKTSIKLEHAISQFPKGLIKLDITPTLEEKISLDMRVKSNFSDLTMSELIDLKEELFSIERKMGSSNFNCERINLLRNYLLHHLLIKAKEANGNLIIYNMERVYDYYEIFTKENIDIEKLFLDVYPSMYSLYDLYENLRDPKIRNTYVFYLKNGQYIIDFFLQELINDFMWNQRDNTFRFNYISSDACNHTKCQDHVLESGNDVNFINVFKKRIN